jgi:hypothetical protein
MKYLKYTFILLFLWFFANLIVMAMIDDMETKSGYVFVRQRIGEMRNE